MNAFQIIGLLLTLAAVLSYVNYRYVKLPTTIGLMLISLLISIGMVLSSEAGLPLEVYGERILERIDFSQTLMHGMLSFLLFAGALHVNLDDLRSQKLPITVLSTVGVTLSTAIIGGLMYLALSWMGAGIPLIYCLLFGSLISPTDPIAVVGLLKQNKAPKALETKIAGESLFNDGVGVVVFAIILELAIGEVPFSWGHVGQLLAVEALGGLALGLLLGWITYQLLKSVDNYQVEVLLTLALVTGGYGLATALHTSGPLAIVAAGLLIGNHGREFAMSDQTRKNLDMFWELIDEVLNAVLFVLIGLEVLVLTLRKEFLLAGLFAIPVVLLARWISVGSLVGLMRLRRPFPPHAIKIMTWGGLRGGISVALALSLPPGRERELLLTVTYVVVIFSILVQGLTMPILLRKTVSPSNSVDTPPGH